MIRNSLKITSSALFLGALVFFAACNKKGKDGLNPTASAQNNAFAEAQFNDITTMVDQAAINSTVLLGAAGTGSNTNVLGPLGSTCATVTVDTVSNPRRITIDFGATNCVCLDGRTRKGKIIATYTGRYRDVGTIIQITFENYAVNDHGIAGTKKITNQGPNQSGNLVYKIEVNGAITKPNSGGTYTWVSTRYREWKEGASTILNILDDVYAVTGSASGINADGTAYGITITKELIRKMNCKWIESGSMKLDTPDMPNISIDYGGGGCDANATVTLLGVSYPIVLD